MRSTRTQLILWFQLGNNEHNNGSMCQIGQGKKGIKRPINRTKRDHSANIIVTKFV